MKTECSYILHHSLLTKEVFIIPSYGTRNIKLMYSHKNSWIDKLSFKHLYDNQIVNNALT